MKSKLHSTRGLKALVALLVFLAGAFFMPATAQDSTAAEAASAAVAEVAQVAEVAAAPAEESAPIDPVVVGLNTLWVHWEPCWYSSCSQVSHLLRQV